MTFCMPNDVGAVCKDGSREPERSRRVRVIASTLSVVRFHQASKSYGLIEQSVQALRDVSVEIADGEFIALVGRSGCGKSTFLSLAGAMDVPTGGEVFIEGISTRSLDDERMTRIRRERIGFVFQFFRLFPTLSVEENVEVPLQLAGHANPRSKARELLGLVEMQALGSRMPHQLSGGQMQRVAIARALAPSPPLLLADEPMGNLDTETSAAIMELFRRVNAELKTTIIMATHSTENAIETDRILSMSDGRLVADEPAVAVAARLGRNSRPTQYLPDGEHVEGR